MFHTISLSLGRTTATVALDLDAAPISCRALLQLLPVTTTAHHAKIAGHEFYLHLPLFLEPERRRRVDDLPEGAVAFWPERQLLCVYYGRIQEEDAAVIPIGRVIADLPALARAAEAMRPRLGRHLHLVHLAAPRGMRKRTAPPPAAPRRSGCARVLMDAYAAIMDAPPPEVQALAASRGVLQPAGKLLGGEAEARKLHEVAWLLRREIIARGAVPPLAVSLLDHFAHRLAGWYGLPDAGRLVAECAAGLPALTAPAAVDAVEALILFIGRLSLWLDAYIPWEAINGRFPRHAAHPHLRGGRR